MYTSLNDDSTALDSTPTRTYIVHDPAFNKGQSQSPILGETFFIIFMQFQIDVDQINFLENYDFK